MSNVAPGTVCQLLEDLAFENPPPEERWFQRDAFDPMHGARELRAAAKRGLIELDAEDDADLWQFRLTPAGPPLRFLAREHIPPGVYVWMSDTAVLGIHNARGDREKMFNKFGLSLFVPPEGATTLAMSPMDYARFRALQEPALDGEAGS